MDRRTEREFNKIMRLREGMFVDVPDSMRNKTLRDIQAERRSKRRVRENLDNREKYKGYREEEEMRNHKPISSRNHERRERRDDEDKGADYARNVFKRNRR